VKYFGINLNPSDDSSYDIPPRRITGAPNVIQPQNLSQRDELSERISGFNERTLSSSQSLHVLADTGEDEENNVTHVHSIGPSPSRTQATTPSIQFQNQTFDLQHLDAQNGTGNMDNGNYNETRPATPTSSIFDDKEHKDGV